VAGDLKASLRGALAGLSVESHEPIGKQIFRSLREAIFTGLLAPGTPLSEKEVSEMFQVSRQPVREAFIKLVDAVAAGVAAARNIRETDLPAQGARRALHP
jgi:DNA-binding GntR family transcriptional regulator